MDPQVTHECPGLTAVHAPWLAATAVTAQFVSSAVPGHPSVTAGLAEAVGLAVTAGLAVAARQT